MKSVLKLVGALLGIFALIALAFLVLKARLETPERPMVNLREESVSAELTPVVGETWIYEAKVQLDVEAELPDGLIDTGADGVTRSGYEKVRRYIGQEEPKEGAGEAFCFEVSLNEKPSEREYAVFTKEGIFSRASQKAGESLMLFDPPILLVPSNRLPGEGWEMGLPDPNNPSGPPMVYRRFNYFGMEKLEIMGKEVEAHRVKINGKTGPIEIQRDFWYSNELGFVKDRRSYFLPDRRLAMIEEVLVEHHVPSEE